MSPPTGSRNAGDRVMPVVPRHGHGRGIVPRLDRSGPTAPLVFLSLSIVLLVLLPIIAHWYVRPLQDDMRHVAEPGRGLVTRIHVAIALQGAALRDFLETGSPGAARRYRDAAATEPDEVSAELELLARRLGTNVGRRYTELRMLEERWRAATEPLLSGAEADAARAADSEKAYEELYEELLIAAARLDESIDAATRDRRARIVEAERIQQRVMVAVAVVALLTIGMIAWLGGRLRAFAAAAAEGHTELARAIESRERLMRGIGHDLKNPLNAIDGHAQLLEVEIHGALSPTQRDSVSRIRKSVRTLLTLVDDLLELSRVESGQLRLAFQTVDIGQLVCDIAAEYRATAEARGHRLIVERPDNGGAIDTDPRRVAQVLGNLVSNAIKYTPGPGRIVLRLRHSHLDQSPMPSGAAVSIDVVDSGLGIPPHRMEEIFSEFTRLEMNLSQPGAGLGLAIARRVARLLGGEVTVANGEEGGAVFTLTLPAEHRAASGVGPSRNGTSGA